MDGNQTKKTREEILKDFLNFNEEEIPHVSRHSGEEWYESKKDEEELEDRPDVPKFPLIKGPMYDEEKK